MSGQRWLAAVLVACALLSELQQEMCTIRNNCMSSDVSTHAPHFIP